MVEALAVLTALMLGLTGLAVARVWFKNQPGQSMSFLVLLFCIWLVATVVWNSFFYAHHVEGLFDLSIERALLLALVPLCAFTVLRRGVDLKAGRQLDLSLLAFLGVCMLSMLVHGFRAKHPEYPQPSFIFVFGYAVPMFGFFFGKYFLRTERDFNLVLLTFLVFGAYLSATAIFERTGLTALVFPKFILDTKYPLHLDRARGPFLNSAFDGIAMIFGLLAAIFFFRRGRLGRKLVLLGAMALTFPAVFYTHTRSVYLVFIYVLGSLLFFYRTRISRWKIIPVVLFAVFLVVAANAGKLLSGDRAHGGLAQMEEVSIRYGLIHRSQLLFAQNPVFGVGLAQFSAAGANPELFSEQQHNHLIGMAVELGVVGLASYLWIYFLIYRRLYKLASDPLHQSPARMNLVLLLGLAFTSNILTNVFVEPSFCLFSNLTTFLFAGMAERLYLTPALFAESPAESLEATGDARADAAPEPA